MTKLPNVDAGYFLAAAKIQDVLNRVPMVASEHQGAISALRSMVEHADGLTTELQAAQAALAKHAKPAPEKE